MCVCVRVRVRVRVRVCVCVCGTVYGEMHLKDLMGSFVRVLHGLRCRKSTIMD